MTKYHDLLAGLGKDGSVSLNRADCEVLEIECDGLCRAVSVKELRAAVAEIDARAAEADEDEEADTGKKSTAERQKQRKKATRKKATRKKDDAKTDDKSDSDDDS